MENSKQNNFDIDWSEFSNQTSNFIFSLIFLRYCSRGWVGWLLDKRMLSKSGESVMVLVFLKDNLGI